MIRSLTHCSVSCRFFFFLASCTSCFVGRSILQQRSFYEKKDSATCSTCKRWKSWQNASRKPLSETNRSNQSLETTAGRRDVESTSASTCFGHSFLSSLWRGFVARLLCVLLSHVFALPRRAVKTRTFPVINTCLRINPHLAMASARCGGIGRFLGRAPCGHGACCRTRFPLSLRLLWSRFCFGRSRWRLGG